MNVKNLLRAAKFLDTLPVCNFNLDVWRKEESCGTVACVLGYSVEIFPERAKEIHNIMGYYYTEVGITLYQITIRQVEELFYPSVYSCIIKDWQSPHGATPQQVAQAIRNFVLAKHPFQLPPVYADTPDWR